MELIADIVAAASHSLHVGTGHGPTVLSGDAMSGRNNSSGYYAGEGGRGKGPPRNGRGGRGGGTFGSGGRSGGRGSRTPCSDMSCNPMIPAATVSAIAANLQVPSRKFISPKSTVTPFYASTLPQREGAWTNSRPEFSCTRFSSSLFDQTSRVVCSPRRCG
jgi:hypothetical protein